MTATTRCAPLFALLLASFALAQTDRAPLPFDQVDQDKDGFIDRDEFDRVRRRFGVVMTFEKLDHDADGRISQPEAEFAREQREIDLALEVVFARTDTDGDGTISPSEYKASDITRRNPDAFSFIDADSDGALSKAEIRKVIVQRRGAATKPREPHEPRPGLGDEPRIKAPAETPLPAGMPKLLYRNQAYDTLPGVDPRLLSLDVYAAKGEGPHPIMVMVHGGGWSAGDKTGRGVIHPKAAWFSQQGFIFASVNYRLSPAVQHPEHANDVAQAIAWLHEHAAEFNGDPDKIFLMGHSAGAHIVAAVASDPRHLERAGLEPTVVKGTVPLDVGAYDMSLRTSFQGNGRAMYESAFGRPEEGKPDPWMAASPIVYTRESGAGERIAPFLLVTSTKPRRRIGLENTQAFAKALSEAGVAAEIAALDKTHGECSSDLGVADDPLTIAVEAFLTRRMEALSAQEAANAPGTPQDESTPE